MGQMSGLMQRIEQIGIVTRDVKAMARRYEEVYGVGPWVIADGEGGLDPKYQAVDLTVRGKRQDFGVSLAWAKVGDIEIELIQPLDELSDYGKFLKEHGEGIHHVSLVTDVPAFERTMEQRGVPTLMTGRVPGSETWIYYDTPAELGMTVEIHDREKG